MTDTRLIQTAREEIVCAMLREYAGEQDVVGRLTLAQHNARNAIRAGRSAWYAYEVIGKSWIDTSLEDVTCMTDALS